jgi:NitT/TauT family transport system substrate-binding protein
MVRGDKADAYLKDPAGQLKGKTIALTANSTGDYAVQSCLRKYGLSKSDVSINNMGQSEIMSALASNNVELVGLWAPNTFTVEEKSGAKLMCSGKDAGAVVPGALIVREDYAKERPEDVAKFVAVYLASWKWLHDHRPEAIAMMTKFYEQSGISISNASMNKEFDLRPTFDLDQQLKAMDRSKGSSEMDQWFMKLTDYMQGTGTLNTAVDPKLYITDEFMKRVKADAKLVDFINNVK